MTNVRVIRWAALACATTLASVLLAPAPAWAHARLLSSTPADQATVAEPVAAVTLTFSDPVKEQFTTVVVTGAGGVAASDGPVRAADRTVTQAVRGLPSGQARVAWRTVSKDGHPIEGAFTFTVGAGGAVAAPAPAAATTAATGRPAAAAAGSGGVKPWVWLLGGGVVLLTAAAGTVLWPRRARATP